MIDVKKISDGIRENIRYQVSNMSRKPKLQIIIFGHNHASELYVANKRKACEKTGIESVITRLDEDTSRETFLRVVCDASNDQDLDGLMVQLPVPEHIGEDFVRSIIPKNLDVDGLADGSPFTPCTPLGIMTILNSIGYDLDGAAVCIIGRSKLVGKPLAKLMTDRNATVTLCHSHTRFLGRYTRFADVIVSATGQPFIIEKGMTAPNAVVIDVGISKLDGKTVGDVSPDVDEVTDFRTPVPGGVGLMTVTMLLWQTLTNAKQMGKK